MTDFEQENQQVINMVNKGRSNSRVGYLVDEKLAKDLATKERQNQVLRAESEEKDKRIEALHIHNQDLAERIHEGEARKIFQRKVILPVIAGIACSSYFFGAILGWMEPIFAVSLGLPCMIAAMMPFAPWHREGGHEA